MEKKLRAARTPPPGIPTSRRSGISGCVIIANAEHDASETFVDIEEPLDTAIAKPLQHKTPSLAFRVWDQDTNAEYTERGFESAALTLFRSEPRRPLNADSVDGRIALDIMFNFHILNSGSKFEYPFVMSP